MAMVILILFYLLNTHFLFFFSILFLTFFFLLFFIFSFIEEIKFVIFFLTKCQVYFSSISYRFWRLLNLTFWYYKRNCKTYCRYPYILKSDLVFVFTLVQNQLINHRHINFLIYINVILVDINWY